jgi:mRNA-degrading endonuclease RelE of RelBE toxin-antitoxin system
VKQHSRIAMQETNFSKPGCYRIEVQGELSPKWSERIGAMQVVSCWSDEDRTVTVLQGRVSDQAELAGILSVLYELHLPLLYVRYLGDTGSH